MEGIEKFKKAFEAFADNYVIVGGTACSIVMTGTAVRPRATHDIDMIVVVEKMTPDFAARFWQFVREAGYRPERRKSVDGQAPKYELYRFLDGKSGYPEMIELLSRHPDILGEPQGFLIEPMLVDADISSLSAIIMDDDFYHFTINHSSVTDGIRHADPAALIALKSRAYLNLLREKAEGRHVNGHDIKKHRSDVLKIVAIMEEEPVPAPNAIVTGVKEFVASIRNDWAILGPSLSNALGQDETFVEALLDTLDNLFIPDGQ